MVSEFLRFPQDGKFPNLGDFPGIPVREIPGREKFEAIREGGNGNFPLNITGLMGRWLLYTMGTPRLVWGSMGQAMGPNPCQIHVCSHVSCAGKAYVTRLKMCLGPLGPHRKELSSTELILLIPSNQFTTTASTGCRRMSCVK